MIQLLLQYNIIKENLEFHYLAIQIYITLHAVQGTIAIYICHNPYSLIVKHYNIIIIILF